MKFPSEINVFFLLYLSSFYLSHVKFTTVQLPKQVVLSLHKKYQKHNSLVYRLKI